MNSDASQPSAAAARHDEVDRLNEELSAAVEAFNAENDSARQVELYHEIVRLRRLLAKGGVA